MSVLFIATAHLYKGWGVELLNFQIEEMNLTDRGFAADYERQSLQMAQAEAKRRAQEAENQRVINVGLCFVFCACVNLLNSASHR